MRDVQGGMTCRNCGAPVTSEICPYCGSSTGLDTSQANMEYPTLECKEANINFWSVVFPSFFAVMFTFGGLMPVLEKMAMSSLMEEETIPAGEIFLQMLFSLPFLLIGLVAFYFTFRPIVRYIIIKKKGKHIEATVYGYVNDSVSMNGTPAQVVKLLIDTPVGKRFIMYQLGHTDQPFGVNTRIGLIVYRNYFMIEKRREVINW